MMPQSIEEYIALAGSAGVGAVILEMVRRHKTKEDKTKLKAEGDSVIVTAVTAAFTGMTTGLREEIERLQSETHEIRDRASALDTDLRAALIRVDELNRLLADKDLQIERLLAELAEMRADIVRIRGERDLARERNTQQEGEIRQLNAIIDAGKRLDASGI